MDVFGIDLSPRMIALARKTYPHLRFDIGTMTDLALGDGAVRGLLAWYSIIHVPDQDLPRVFAEFRRVLAPGGQALLAFQVGDEPRLITEAFGQTVALEFRRRQPERVAELLADADLAVWSTTVRQAGRDESVPQAYLFATRAAN
jgi:ubiquinone/menaquinone biosynthesis C-methylase UbiE